MSIYKCNTELKPEASRAWKKPVTNRDRQRILPKGRYALLIGNTDGHYYR